MQRAYGSSKRSTLQDRVGCINNPPNRTGALGLARHRRLLPELGGVHLRAQPGQSKLRPVLLDDPSPPLKVPYDLWAVGLFTYTGQPKVTDSAWRLPLYLPVPATKPSHSLEVWGCVRPSAYAIADTGSRRPQIQPTATSTCG